MVFVPALGGHVPYRDKKLCTTLSGVFVAGDAAGVEEASAAMVEGQLAGLSAAEFLGYAVEDIEGKRGECLTQLESLRKSAMSERIRAGIAAAELTS